jgi:hypothetical protein
VSSDLKSDSQSRNLNFAFDDLAPSLAIQQFYNRFSVFFKLAILASFLPGDRDLKDLRLSASILLPTLVFGASVQPNNSSLLFAHNYCKIQPSIIVCSKTHISDNP